MGRGFQREPISTKRVAIVKEEIRASGESLERDITEKIEKLAMRAETSTFEDMKMSDAFRDEESDNEEERDDEVYGIEEEDGKQRPFEDCPMPILKCAVHTPSEKLEMKMLIDSRSSLDLISETMARKLQRKGCVTEAMKKIVRIKWQMVEGAC